LSLAECRLGALPVTPYGWELGVIEQERPDLVYVIPHFHNPTGRRASFEQKQKLANASSKRGFFVIEDDAYGELNFDGTFNRPLIADCPERGILVGSFSKTLCPGLRIGYIVAPTLLLSALIKTLQATTLQPGTLAQVLAFETLSRLDYDTYLERLRSFYRQRAMALSRRCRALGLEHLMPDGGFFLWVKTPGCASEFAQQAAASGVLAVPEIAFRASGMRGPNQHLRLAFSRYDDATTAAEKLEQAVMSVTFKTVRT
jgi:2-aminoadipate transaminase